MGGVCSACTERDSNEDKRFGKAKPELGTTPKTKEGAVTLYDEWAGDYDETLKSWGFVAPENTAEFVRQFNSDLAVFSAEKDRVLDAGCGTGLAGEELKKKGFKKITGIDVSPESLKLIEERKPGLYEVTAVADLDSRINFEDNVFGAITCVGVLSYVNDYEMCFSEWIRVTKVGGLIVFTHRQGQGTALDEAANKLEEVNGKKKRWKQLKKTGPMDYMPLNPEPEERAKKIRYYVYQVC